MKRVPASATPPTPARVPKRLRGVSLDGPGREHHPLWRLSLLDDEFVGSWSWKVDERTIGTIVCLLQEMERLTWAEVRNQMTGGERRRGAKHKSIPVENLCSEAQARLEEIGLGDWDELFRFRTGNMHRLWGIIVDENGAKIFYPIWWDPDHKVCPSKEQ